MTITDRARLYQRRGEAGAAVKLYMLAREIRTVKDTGPEVVHSGR